MQPLAITRLHRRPVVSRGNQPCSRPPPRTWTLLGTALLALWVVALLIGPQALVWAGLVLNPHGHVALHAHGHPFIDARAWRNLPNAMDVLSNLPLVGVGVWGWLAGRRDRDAHLARPDRTAAQVFFVGLVLSGLGSVVYHWAPDAQGLVLDRLGMAVAFAGVLSLAAAERVGAALAAPTLWIALTLAAFSAVLPLTQGNVLPWVVVQFGGLALVGWAALRPPVTGACNGWSPVSLLALIAWYALAKALEWGDSAVFHASGEIVSGHSLKHVAGALAAWPVLSAIRQNARASAGQ